MAQTACMSACKHLATSLLQLLLEAEVRQLSLGALQQFNLDVEECERKTPGLAGGQRWRSSSSRGGQRLLALLSYPANIPKALAEPLAPVSPPPPPPSSCLLVLVPRGPSPESATL